MRKILLLLSIFIMASFIASQTDALTVGYSRTSSSGGPATIDSITAYMVARENFDTGEVLRLRIVTEGANTSNSGDQSLTTSYASYDYTLTTNPDDSAAWELTDLDGLQIGVYNPVAPASMHRVTQIYLQINWSDTSTTILRPNGDVTTANWSTTDTTYYTEVDEVSHDSDTTYCSSVINAAVLLFDIENP